VYKLGDEGELRRLLDIEFFPNLAEEHDIELEEREERQLDHQQLLQALQQLNLHPQLQQFGIPHIMAYAQFAGNRRVRMLVAAPWYNAAEFMTLLNNFRDKNPNLVNVRAEMLEALSKIRVAIPFGAAARFPENVDYICEATGSWPHLFQTLRSALSYKVANNVGKNRVEKTEDAVEHQNTNDAIIAFWASTTAIIDRISKLEEVWDRTTFETHFQLIWA